MSAVSIEDVRRTLISGVFPILSGTGFWITFYRGIEHGLMKHLWDLTTGKNDNLPNSKHKLIRNWTGIRLIDDYLVFYVAYFLPKPTGYPTMELQGRHFLGQYAALWILMQLERSRQPKTLIPEASLLATGFLVQTFGAGTTIPLWCAYDLATSVMRPSGGQAHHNPSTTLTAFPISTVLTTIIPLVSAIYMRQSYTKQAALVVWQVYYLFTEVLERSLPFVLNALPISTAISASQIYTVAERLSALTHISVVASIIISKLAPGMIRKTFSHLRFTEAFWPRVQLRKPSDVMEARQHFLRGDEFFTVVSVLLWAVAKYIIARQYAPNTSAEMSKLAVQYIARVCAFGPVGAVAWLLRKRDLLQAP